MLILHDYAPSLNGWKVRVLLDRLGLAYETNFVPIFSGGSRSDSFLALNPVGAIPVLQLEDGRAVAESNAILVYLAAGTRFLPSERFANAKIMQWLFFEQYYVEPAIGTLRFWTLTGRLERQEGAMIDSRRQTGARALAAMDRSLHSSSFLHGDTLTVADIAVYAYSHRAGEAGFDLERYPAVRRWMELVARHISPGNPVHPYGREAHG